MQKRRTLIPSIAQNAGIESQEAREFVAQANQGNKVSTITDLGQTKHVRGLVAITVRMRPEIANGLRRASLERQLAGDLIYTQRDLLEWVLDPWLRKEGFL